MSAIRVLVVDDSVVVRKLVTDALSNDSDIEVIGVAANGKIAVAKAEQLAPDAITMDIEMPEMNGIDAVRVIRATGSRTPIIMFSTLTEAGAAATLDALSAGASDYVTKPANMGSVNESIAKVRSDLVPKLKALVRRAPGGPTAPRPAEPVSVPARTLANVQQRSPQPFAAPQPWRVSRTPAGAPIRPVAGDRSTHPAQVLVIGSSTGGPEALTKVLGSLSAPPPVPVLLVQHMPAVFTRQLAERLDRISRATVVEAQGGEVLQAGVVYVAPGGRHLTVRKMGTQVVTELSDAPPVQFCKPSVDVLFSSVADAVGGEVLAVVLTGMGADGRDGCGSLVKKGATVIVQDEPTSTVWGMPGAVVQAGLAHQILPLGEVAAAIERQLAAVTERPLAGARAAGRVPERVTP